MASFLPFLIAFWNELRCPLIFPKNLAADLFEIGDLVSFNLLPLLLFLEFREKNSEVWGLSFNRFVSFTGGTDDSSFIIGKLAGPLLIGDKSGSWYFRRIWFSSPYWMKHLHQINWIEFSGKAFSKAHNFLLLYNNLIIILRMVVCNL